MNVLITGASRGIGFATTNLFLSRGHRVYGIDWNSSSIQDSNYTHYLIDIRDKESLPNIPEIEILINNAGVQGSYDDIDVNLKGLINVTEAYGLQKNIHSILNQASVSAWNGAEFDRYVASKGGVLSYTRWVAKEIAKYGATCNSLSCGGVITELNSPVMEDSILWNKIMEQTPLKKWATAEEIAEWIYFFTVINRSCSGQDLIIDNLETLNHRFIW